MKEIDDTEPPKTESVADLLDQIVELEDRMEELVKRIANLEARKPPQDTNPDPEWYA
jgi:ubiquinone biosynthesis protein UbiJ